MDSNNQKLLKSQNNNNLGEAADRISELPDAILHYILSFLDEAKCVAATSILSTRWNHIWKSIPTLVFRYTDYSEYSTDKFMNFMDRTLLLHDPSSIQKIYLEINRHLNASRVHSWISNITSRGVEEVSLRLSLLEKPFFLPVSVFRCESLTILKLSAPGTTIHVPKILFDLPKLKSLTLRYIKFADDDVWNEQHFSNCPVLEKLSLKYCSWVGMRKFCILNPALKVLKIENYFSSNGGNLQDCDLKVYAPSLVSLTHRDKVAKEYDLSISRTLKSAEVYFYEYDANSEQKTGYCAAVTKYLQALSHVQSLTIFATALEVLLDANDFVNDLPTFHNLNQLELILGPVSDKLIFALLGAAPKLERLRFDNWVFNDGNDDIVYYESEDLFRHLQSVRFIGFSGDPRELRWAKLILKNATSLQTMTIGYYCYSKGKTKEEVLMSELSSLPRASERCVFKFV